MTIPKKPVKKSLVVNDKILKEIRKRELDIAAKASRDFHLNVNRYIKRAQKIERILKRKEGSISSYLPILSPHAPVPVPPGPAHRPDFPGIIWTEKQKRLFEILKNSHIEEVVYYQDIKQPPYLGSVSQSIDKKTYAFTYAFSKADYIQGIIPIGLELGWLGDKEFPPYPPDTSTSEDGLKVLSSFIQGNISHCFMTNALYEHAPGMASITVNMMIDAHDINYPDYATYLCLPKEDVIYAKLQGDVKISAQCYGDITQSYERRLTFLDDSLTLQGTGKHAIINGGPNFEINMDPPYFEVPRNTTLIFVNVYVNLGAALAYNSSIKPDYGCAYINLTGDNKINMDGPWPATGHAVKLNSIGLECFTIEAH